MHLEPVAYGDTDARWPEAEAWVESAVKEGALFTTVENYRTRCRDLVDSAQLWLIKDGDTVVGAGVTEIYLTGRGRTFGVPVLAAKSFTDVLVPLFDVLTNVARAEQCVRLEGFGRPGWVGALKHHGWRPVSVVIEKEI